MAGTAAAQPAATPPLPAAPQLPDAATLVFDAYEGFQCSEDCNFSAALKDSLYVGIGLYLVGTLDDIATAPGAARAANQRHRDIALAPMIRRDTSGLMLTGRF